MELASPNESWADAPEDIIRVILGFCNPTTFTKLGMQNRRYKKIVSGAWKQLAACLGVPTERYDQAATRYAAITYTNIMNRRCKMRLLSSVSSLHSMVVSCFGDKATITTMHEQYSSYSYTKVDSYHTVTLADIPNLMREANAPVDYDHFLWNLGPKLASVSGSHGWARCHWSKINVLVPAASKLRSETALTIPELRQYDGFVNRDPSMGLFGLLDRSASTFLVYRIAPKAHPAPIDIIVLKNGNGEPLEWETRSMPINPFVIAPTAFCGSLLTIPTDAAIVTVFDVLANNSKDVAEPGRREIILPSSTTHIFNVFNDGHEVIIVAETLRSAYPATSSDHDHGGHSQTLRACVYIASIETCEVTREINLPGPWILAKDLESCLITADAAFIYIYGTSGAIGITSRGGNGTCTSGDQAMRLVYFHPCQTVDIRLLHSIGIGKLAIASSSALSVVDFTDTTLTRKYRCVYVPVSKPLVSVEVSEGDFVDVACQYLHCQPARVACVALYEQSNVNVRYLLICNSGNESSTPTPPCLTTPTRNRNLLIAKNGAVLTPFIIADQKSNTSGLQKAYRHNRWRGGRGTRGGADTEHWAFGTVVVVKHVVSKTGQWEWANFTVKDFEAKFVQPR